MPRLPRKPVDISHIQQFLACETPDQWLQNALDYPEELLIDHANCEKKAASTAINMMYRYVDRPDLQFKMSRLAREELRHYEQVMNLMRKRKIAYRHIESARYASGLRELVRTHEPARLIDILIVGAFIEARSCERFSRLAPLLDAELNKFYVSLLRSESRHYEDYLGLAAQYAEGDISDRVAIFREREAELVQAPDSAFTFHSGPIEAA